jgi:heat shock protein HslJ
MKKIILFAMTIFLLAACSSTPKVDLVGEWKLVSYGDVTNPTPALPGVETTIKFENGQISGNVGCNSFGGEYEVKGDTVVFGPIVSTLMYCEESSTQEQGVLAVFANGVDLSIQMNGEILMITSPDGLTVVNLARK